MALMQSNTANSPNSSSPTPRLEEPFRFLDLPPELRCIVYDQVDYSKHRRTLSSVDMPDGPSKVIQVSECLPVSLLATCKLVNKEARTIFNAKLETMKAAPMCFEVDPAAKADFCGLMVQCSTYFDRKDHSSRPCIRKLHWLMCSKSSGNRTFDLEVRMSKDIRDWRRKDLLVITETLYRLCCRGFAIVLQGTESKARAMSLERSPARESWECLRCYTQDRFPILQRPMLRLASLEAGE
jgi:RNase P subunit RPR2|tara:strand:- start:5035 stop:5751 length:717 start_codon:yes stop_codon:yes gene_type:complete